MALDVYFNNTSVCFQTLNPVWSYLMILFNLRLFYGVFVSSSSPTAQTNNRLVLYRETSLFTWSEIEVSHFKYVESAFSFTLFTISHFPKCLYSITPVESNLVCCYILFLSCWNKKSPPALCSCAVYFWWVLWKIPKRRCKSRSWTEDHFLNKT